MKVEISQRKKKQEKNEHMKTKKDVTKKRKKVSYNEIKEEIKKKKKKLKTTLQNLWDETKAVLRGKSIAIDAFLKKQTNQKSIKNYLNLSPLETTKRTKETISKRFPRWHSGKELACQCRRHRFDPWVGKIPRSRKQQTTPVFLPGEFHAQGYSPWGHKESDTTEQLTHTLASWITRIP